MGAGNLGQMPALFFQVFRDQSRERFPDFPVDPGAVGPQPGTVDDLIKDSTVRNVSIAGPVIPYPDPQDGPDGPHKQLCVEFVRIDQRSVYIEQDQVHRERPEGSFTEIEHT